MDTRLERLLAAVTALKERYENEAYHYGITPEQSAQNLEDLIDDWKKENKAEAEPSVLIYHTPDNFRHPYRVRRPSCENARDWEYGCDVGTSYWDAPMVDDDDAEHFGCDDYRNYDEAFDDARRLAKGLGVPLRNLVPQDKRYS